MSEQDGTVLVPFPGLNVYRRNQTTHYESKMGAHYLAVTFEPDCDEDARSLVEEKVGLAIREVQVRAAILQAEG